VQLSDAKARLGAVEELLSGEIIATAFNGIFALVGDADDPRVPQKLAAAKGRPRAKGVALICPPGFLREHRPCPAGAPALGEHPRSDGRAALAGPGGQRSGGRA